MESIISNCVLLEDAIVDMIPKKYRRQDGDFLHMSTIIRSNCNL